MAAWSEQGDEQRRPGLSTAAASTVAARADQVAFDWHASGEASDHVDGSTLVSVLVEALRSCGGNTRRGHVHDGLTELFGEHPWLEHLDGADVTCLREIVRRQVLADLPPGDALAALHCISAVFDGLSEHLSARRLHQLEAVAFIDPLTGLGNRRAADDAITTQFATATRHGRPLSVVVVDVDNLKVTNDTIGHDAGDAVLTRLADAFRAGLRQGDVAYRTGGDEFLLLLPETTLDDVDRVMDRVVLSGAPEFSYGAAEGPDEAATPVALIRVADQRLLATRRATREPAMARRRAVTPSLRGVGVVVAVAAAVIAAAAVPATLMIRQTGRVVSTSMQQPVTEQFPLADQVETARNAAETAEPAPPPLVEFPVAPVEEPAVEEPAPSAQAPEAPTGTARRPRSFRTAGEPTTPSPTTTTTRPPPTTTTSSPPPTTTTQPTTTTTEPRGDSPSASRTTEEAEQRPTRGPRLADDRATVQRREWTVLPVLANDDPGDSRFDLSSLTIVSAPRGNVKVHADGTISYRPADDLSHENDRFQYRICTEAGSCGQAWVTLEVREGPPPD